MGAIAAEGRAWVALVPPLVYLALVALAPGPSGALLLALPAILWLAAIALAYRHALLDDASERRAGARALREAEERFRRAFDDAPIGMALVTPAGEWIQVNQALSDITGYPKAELARMGAGDLAHPDDAKPDVEALAELRNGSRRRLAVESRYVHANGEEIWIAQSVCAVRDADGRVAYLISQMQDVTERRRAVARLTHQALHDPLTGLPNRTLFTDRMLSARARLHRGGSLALLFCDVDRFKDVNDGIGHDAGDRLLVELARRLRGELRPSDTVCRLGGDEFAILCEGVDLEMSEGIARRIGAAFAAPVEVGGAMISVTASLGVTLSDDPGVDSDRLLAEADAAMYAAKRAGRARHRVFDPRMRSSRGDAARTPDRHSRRFELERAA